MITAFSSIAQTAKKPVPRKVTPVKTVRVAGSGTKVNIQNTVADNLNNNAIKVKMTTDMGVMTFLLYDSTPLHRDNFAKLVKEGFYDSLMFHRVIPGFMIQGGDPLSKNAAAGVMLGNGGDNMQRIPGEFRQTLIHKKGVLAAARDNNPEKASSACQFYIVEGKVYTDLELDQMESGMGRKFSPAARLAYKTIGGTPFLDQNYTVFGEILTGMDVIGKISAVQKDGANRPVQDIRMKIELIK